MLWTSKYVSWLYRELSSHVSRTQFLVRGSQIRAHPKGVLSVKSRNLFCSEISTYIILFVPGTTTHRWKDGDSTIDLTFATENLASRTIHCKIVNQLDCDSDHLPVDVAIDWHYQPATPTRKRLWAKTNVQVLRQKVKELLPNELEAGDLSNNHDIDAYVAAIVKALDTGINESTPWSNPSPRSIQGFDEECKEIWKEVQQLRRTWQRTRQDDDYEAYRKACNRKGRHIRKILRDAHRQRVEEASTNSSGLWKLVKWAKNRHIPSSACTPALVMPDGGLAEGPEERRRRCDSHSSHLPHRPTCPI
ncbi:hypothetical protein ARSEF4850_002402 [Beauveria asiatica]